MDLTWMGVGFMCLGGFLMGWSNLHQARPHPPVSQVQVNPIDQDLAKAVKVEADRWGDVDQYAIRAWRDRDGGWFVTASIVQQQVNTRYLAVKSHDPIAGVREVMAGLGLHRKSSAVK